LKKVTVFLYASRRYREFLSKDVKYIPQKHHRHSVRLKGYNYTKPGAYFLTICTYNRECLFGDIADGKMILNAFGKIAEAEWLRSPEIRSYVELDEYSIMPNHVHGIIMVHENVGATRRVAPTDKPHGPKPGSVGAIVGQFKSVVIKQINRSRGTPSAPVWQRNYHEHIIRDEMELNRIREYIRQNPLKWAEDRENLIFNL
jgi:putative transposase